MIVAASEGPKVQKSTEELDFKNPTVLKEYKESFTITNDSEIEAEYTAFTKDKNSIWKVMQRSGVLLPEETKTIEVICCADEAQKFADTLHVVINNGKDLEIQLKANATGPTLKCKDNLELVDFGTCYTHKQQILEFFVENRGRKNQTITWVPDDKGKRGKPKKKEDGNQTKTQVDTTSKKTGVNPDNSQISAAEKGEEEAQY